MQLSVPWRRGQSNPFTSIPRINWAHPLAQKLVSYWYDTGTGAVLDLVTGRTMVPASTQVRPASIGSSFGKGNYYSTATQSGMVDQTAFSKQAWAAPYSFAVGWWQVSAPTVAANQIYFGLQDNTGNDAFGLYTDNTLKVSYGNGAPNAILTQPLNNTFNVYIGVATGTSTQSNYLNSGASTASAQTSAFTGTAMSHNINGTTAGWVAGASQAIGAQIFFGATWTRALRAPEALQLYLDPYCFLIYPEDEMFASLVNISAAVTSPTWGWEPESAQKYIFSQQRRGAGGSPR